jgi:hypothetical protein
MLELYYDNEGKVIGAMCWRMCNEKGLMDDNGIYGFVDEIWIWNGTKDGIKIIREFINRCFSQFPQMQYAYWKRKKYSNRIKVYTRKEIYGLKFN